MEEEEELDREALIEQLRSQIAAKDAKIEEERKRLLEAEDTLNQTKIIKAKEFFVQPLETARTLSEYLESHELLLEGQDEADRTQAAASSEQMSDQSSKRSRTSITKKRTFQHVIATDVQRWSTFQSDMDNFLDLMEDRVITRQPETKVRESTVFELEAAFEVYWSAPRQTSLQALVELFPEALQGTTYMPHKKQNGGIPDTVFVKGERSLTLLEQKHPGVQFDLEIPVAQVWAQGQPMTNIIKRKNTLCVLVQTYTYMVGHKVKYAAFSNWNHWVLLKREIGPQNQEILYASDYIGLDRARLGWSTIVRLSCVEHNARECGEPGGLGKVPDWLITQKKKKDGGAGGSASGGGGDSTSFSGGAGEGGESDDAGQVNDELHALYPETTTRAALGVDALSLLSDFEVLADTEKSHTRRVQVNGQDLVVKLVDFIGVPKQCEFSANDLYDLEWNEVRIYHHLKDVQGSLIPHFLYHGSDLNHIWATAVTTYEGQSFDALLGKNQEITREMQAAALVALRRLHELGVLHGDLALRNALWHDDRVIWVDFEMSCLREDKPEDFDARANEEIEELGELFKKLPVSSSESPSLVHVSVSTSLTIITPPPPTTADAAGAPMPASDCGVGASPVQPVTVTKRTGSPGSSSQKQKRTRICPCL